MNLLKIMKTHSQIWIQNGNEINTSTKNGALSINRNYPGSEIWQQEKSEIRYLWSSTCEGYFYICADFRNIEVHVQKSRYLWFVKESIDQSLTLILTFLMEVILKPTLCFQLIDMHSKFYYTMMTLKQPIPLAPNVEFTKLAVFILF